MGTEPKFKHSVNKQKGKGTQGWPLQVKAEFQYRRVSLGFDVHLSPCVHLQNLLCLIYLQ